MNDAGKDAVTADSPEIDALLELYSIHANLISINESKRQLANQIYMAIVSAIMAAASVIITDENTTNDDVVDLFAVSILLICTVWYLTIQYHRRLSSAKFSVVLKIEKHFPIQPFDEEWKNFKSETTKPWSLELTTIERSVPIIVGALSLAVLLVRNWSYFTNLI